MFHVSVCSKYFMCPELLATAWESWAGAASRAGTGISSE